ncbi:hypothetical protein IRJ41_022565, partial [Triplophysa rosa]
FVFYPRGITRPHRPENLPLGALTRTVCRYGSQPRGCRTTSGRRSVRVLGQKISRYCESVCACTCWLENVHLCRNGSKSWRNLQHKHTH